LIVQEQAGFLTALEQLSWHSGSFLADGIQQVFGTTQLAPYGMLRGTLCPSTEAGVMDTYELFTGSEAGEPLFSDVQVTFEGTASASAFSVSPTAVNFSAANSSQSASGTVALNFGNGSPSWTAQILPANLTSSWLTVSPVSGHGAAKLQVQAAGGLSNGVYNAIVAIQSSSSSPQAIIVPVTFVVGASNALSISGATNAASNSQTYAPGMILSVYGSQLAPALQTDTALPLMLTMQGVSATVNGVSAPLYYISPAQINIQIPYETGLGTAVLGINNNGAVTSLSFPVTIAAPGIFAANGSLVPSSTGAQGQTLVAYITGSGDNTPTLVTGTAPGTLPPDVPVSAFPQPLLPVALTVGGVPATLTFVGVPGWSVGVTQVNFTIPPNAPTGAQPVVVTVGGVASSPVTLNVTAQ
jgi:uncharacterized protein (TIGR03437 family)